MSKEIKEAFSFDAATQKALEPFGKEALSKDSSRGFDLTSIKAQYVVERLNNVFGLVGWQHQGEYRLIGPENKPTGVLFFGKLSVMNGVLGASREAVGYSAIKNNVGDAYKGAKTDSLSKCSSQLGIGNEVYKGNVKLSSTPTRSRAKSNGASAGSDF